MIEKLDDAKITKYMFAGIVIVGSFSLAMNSCHTEESIGQEQLDRQEIAASDLFAVATMTSPIVVHETERSLSD